MQLQQIGGTLARSVSKNLQLTDRSARCQGQVSLWHLWWLNARIGAPERARGLHYWLGFEYALVLNQLALAPGDRLFDIGSGPYSVFPYLVAHLCGVRVTASDIDEQVARQRTVRARAARAGLRRAHAVEIIRSDARALSFADASFDAVTAISTLEHMRGLTGDQAAVREAARVLRPGGRLVITVPFRAAGSMDELDADRQLWQRHYGLRSLHDRLIAPSGLGEIARTYYAERLPFYDLTRQLPLLLDWLRRPWDTALSAVLIAPTDDLSRASAVCLALSKPVAA